MVMHKTMLLLIVFILSGCVGGHSNLSRHHVESIEKQKAINSIMALQAQYLIFCDQLMTQEIGRPDNTGMVNKLFMDDGEWIVSVNKGADQSYRGKAELLKMFDGWENSYAKKENYHVKHFSMNPQIAVKGDTATNREQLLVFHADGKNKKSFWIYGYYTDVYRKTPEGEWKIALKKYFRLAVKKYFRIKMSCDYLTHI